jgi:hypothetical protein
VSTSANDLERRPALAVTAVAVTDEVVQFDLSDGRTVSAPLAWYPRLAHGTPPSAPTGAWLAAAPASTGPTWTRTSALMESSPASPQARVRHP